MNEEAKKCKLKIDKMQDYNPIENNEYELVLKSSNSLFNEKWSAFFSESAFTFYIAPIVGDLIDLLCYFNDRDEEDLEFKKEFSFLFPSKYVKIIERIHASNRCILIIEPHNF